jgi:hypothetical protein
MGHQCARQEGRGPRAGLLADSVDLLRQLGLVALPAQHVIPASFHHWVGHGAWPEPGIHRDHASLQEETTPDVFQDRALLGLVRGSLLPQSPSHAVTQG